ncbi:hypothetical protein FC75_GL001739 [Lacticaseibacillus camelliae DSM 22697 = JCM 13995]|uniref:Uncharacterized protein n=1 Tax=Lacticaseibacillus camelliae DSM 22697 = JCM 13995 TaxID=1423730 RepID=A0A0R2F383_9LACO|nr:hypothetical protein FC75_GL001739 [Lacticaseibacillus camelliae DSM 22697 = JCM 13995]
MKISFLYKKLYFQKQSTPSIYGIELDFASDYGCRGQKNSGAAASLVSLSDL